MDCRMGNRPSDISLYDRKMQLIRAAFFLSVNSCGEGRILVSERGDEIKVINKKSDIGLGTPKASLSVPKLD